MLRELIRKKKPLGYDTVRFDVGTLFGFDFQHIVAGTVLQLSLSEGDVMLP